MRMRLMIVGLVLAVAGACNSELLNEMTLAFLEGTSGNPQIGLVVNSLGRSVSLFQLGNPEESRQIPLGASSQVTPVGLSVGGRRAVVPLGNAASAALVDLEALRIERFFLFPSGNATGSVFVDENTILLANLVDDVVGRVAVDQPNDAVGVTVQVAPAPSAMVMAGGRAFIVSSNLDENFSPIGNGIVTVLDPVTMTVVTTIETGGTNSGGAAVGPDGMVYVVNTGDFVTQGSMTIIDPNTLEVVETVGNMGAGPIPIAIDDGGLVYVSGFFFGTIVWDSNTGTFVRNAANPVCAPVTGGACRGAADAVVAANGDLYQVFFGSAADGLAPGVFVYDGATLSLADSVTVGSGPTSMEIGEFRP